ncbi:hypothetical protein ACGFIY_21270 [Micromonospora chersina]|uniref:hypothetical protein n=1 Tax=Micromonospora chersina TaxID=47854 RepID=UPI0037246D13
MAASDPKAELRQVLADKLLARWVEEGYAGNTTDLPIEGQCEQIAGWVVDMFTVEEDYQSIEDQRLGDPTPTTMWHRRLVAATDWQPTQPPEPAP